MTLDLIRRVIPNAPAAHYDSGAEYSATYEMVKHVDAIPIKPEHDLIWMCKYGGYWRHENPTDYETNFDFKKILVVEPAERFVDDYRLDVIAMGLRGQESYGRRMNAKTRGAFYPVEYKKLQHGLHHLCPIIHWSHDDVWAYIAGRNLKYNSVYDRMAEIGIDRKEQRVSCILGMVGAGTGWRFSLLRQVDPNRFNELAGEFPMIKEFC